jgi:WD40 repeat protein
LVDGELAGKRLCVRLDSLANGHTVSSTIKMQEIPLVTVQHDFNLDLQANENGQFWVSIYRIGQEKTSIHAKVNVKNDGLECSDDRLKVAKLDDETLKVSFADSEVVSKAAKLAFSVGKKVNCIATTPSSAMIAAGGDDGFLIVGETLPNGIRKEFKGHVGDLTSVHFFPSNKVILSTGDLSVRIWDAASGHCAQTLKGHTSIVLAAQICGLGKNIVSADKGGKILLFHVASGKVLRQVASLDSAVNDLALVTWKSVDSYEASDLEFETTDKLLFAVTQGGDIVSMNLKGTILHRIKVTDSLTCIAYSSKDMIITGSATGVLQVYTFELKPLVSWKTSDASITGVYIKNDNICVSTNDGQCYTCFIQDGIVKIKSIFVGADVDPVVASNGVTGCRDGFVRLYAS